jgi:hypothetical protein
VEVEQQKKFSPWLMDAHCKQLSQPTHSSTTGNVHWQFYLLTTADVHHQFWYWQNCQCALAILFVTHPRCSSAVSLSYNSHQH